MIRWITNLIKSDQRKTIPFHVLIRKDDEGDSGIVGYALSEEEGNKYCAKNKIPERFIKLYVTPFYKGYLVSNYKHLRCTTEK